MNILELAQRAKQYYESTRKKREFTGYERNVLIREDFENCLFVKADYVLQPGDIIFRIKTQNQQTIIELSIDNR